MASAGSAPREPPDGKGDLPPLDLPRALAALERGISDGLHYGAQLSVLHAGRRADICVGVSTPGVALSPEHVLCWSSSVKPVLSVALGLLYEQGLVDFDDPVAKHIPDFAAEGKGMITIRHLLTHTAGLWQTASGVGETEPPAAILAKICSRPPEMRWVPGKRCGYDSPAWYVGAGVVSAVDPKRRPYEQFVEEEIFAPLGLSACSIGMSSARYEALSAEGRLALIYDMSPMARGARWKATPPDSSAERVRHACPAGNGRGPARELAALYAALLRQPGEGDVLLQPSTVEMLTRTAREGIYDELQGTETAWSLGFALRCILSGRHASERAFGHGGSQSSWAFGDPEHGLAVACICNGKPGTQAHYRRVGEVSTALYEDLGLISEAGDERTFQLPMGLGTF